jgi:hypothetical protein
VQLVSAAAPPLLLPPPPPVLPLLLPLLSLSHQSCQQAAAAAAAPCVGRHPEVQLMLLHLPAQLHLLAAAAVAVTEHRHPEVLLLLLHLPAQVAPMPLWYQSCINPACFGCCACQQRAAEHSQGTNTHTALLSA